MPMQNSLKMAPSTSSEQPVRPVTRPSAAAAARSCSAASSGWSKVCARVSRAGDASSVIARGQRCPSHRTEEQCSQAAERRARVAIAPRLEAALQTLHALLDQQTMADAADEGHVAVCSVRAVRALRGAAVSESRNKAQLLMMEGGRARPFRPRRPACSGSKTRARSEEKHMEGGKARERLPAPAVAPHLPGD